MIDITRELAQRVDDVVTQGLVRGVGQPIPGKMCVEAAVCFALGLPHGDSPTCVGSAVRAFKLRLNDAWWSSDAARTKGMRKLAVAQLGSNTIDQQQFVEAVTLSVIREILPPMLRRRGLHKHADACEAVTTPQEGKKAAAAADAAAAAADAADAAAYAAADAAADIILLQAADICLKALVELQSPGVAFLDIIPEGA